jgi:hypothetical protein
LREEAAVYVTHPAQSVVNFGAIVWSLPSRNNNKYWNGQFRWSRRNPFALELAVVRSGGLELDEFFGGAAKYHHKVYENGQSWR